ncbi:hypothetical protein [Nibribacter koreensis]|uniref:Lipoprotein n=1 Tax=Nibribacter koreensis TaxID=1084519 RepID=A0ABP8FIN4_9BACT
MRKTLFALGTCLFLASCGTDSATTTTSAQEDSIAAAAEEAKEEELTPEPDATETETMDDNAMEAVIAEEVSAGTSTSASKAPTSDNPLFNLSIQKGQAGAVKIGMPIEELQKQYGYNKLKEVELQQEGTAVKAYEVLGERNRTDLRVEQQCKGTACKVWRITVLNPAFKTQSGIGIGSTYKDLKTNMNIKSVAQGEGNFVAISEDNKMSFVLDVSSMPAGNVSKLKVNTVPGDTKVTSVMLF